MIKGILGKILIVLLISFVSLFSLTLVDAVSFSSSHTTLARTMAEEGTVLLKNDYNALPLKKNEHVAGLGIAQDVGQIFGGGGSGWVNSGGAVNYATGLMNAAKSGLIKSYKPIGSANINEAFNKVIYFINRNTTEGNDIEESNYYLNSVEKNDIKTLIERNGKERVIVVLNVGSVIDTTWLIEQDVAAIVLAYLGGEQAGNALANVLTGKVNPSGKVVDTWAKSYDYYPSSNESGIGTFAGDKNSYYTEDIYVGYRYFATFDPNYEKVNYEFGYGLSYTNFELSNQKVDLEDDSIKVSVDVKNTGAFAGKEVVQLYFNSPEGKLGASKAELAGFAKTSLLKPGQTETVEIEFSKEEFAKYDDLGKIKKNSWVLEKGDYSLFIGNSIKNATSSKPIYTYNCANDLVLDTTYELKETTLPKRLLSNGEYENLINGGSMQKTTIVPQFGSATIQAEDYSLMTGTGTSEIYYVGTDVAFGLGNINKENNILEYKLYVEEAGIYNMGFNMAAAWDNQKNMFDLFVNGVEQDIVVSMNATHTDSDNKWHATTYLKDVSYKVNLPQGDVTLRFESNGTNFMNFDSFVIYNNKVSDSESTIIQAENFNSSTLATEQIADGAATARSNKANNQYIYNLNVRTAGIYYLSLDMSNVTVASQDVLSVYVNNTKQNVAIDLMRTAVNGDVLDSNYHTFITTNGVGIYLPAGEVALKFVTNNKAVCCIDSFTLTPENIHDDSSNSVFVNNTSNFTYQDNMNGVVLDKLITYNDVCLDNSKIDAFLSQLSINELVQLSGLDISQTPLPTGVGGIGGQYIDSKYGIPSAYCADGPAGIRYTDSKKYATWFPCMTMLASTWNIELASQFGEAIGTEALAGDVDVWLAPGVNIHRNPLCGRNFEYFSEDPLVSGRFGATITKGVQSLGVSVCVKHYVGNEQETNRFGMNSCISNRALREIYLKAFEIVVKEGNPYSIMSSYNMVNGTHVASSSDLITDVLRNEWGFEGAVFSDWWPHMSHISLVQSGNTFKSASPEYDSLVAAYHSGVLTREDFEKIAKVCIEFIIKSTANNQNTILVDSNKTNELDVNNLTFKGDTGSGSAGVWRISIVDYDDYLLNFNNLSNNVKVTLNGNTLDLENSKSLVRLEEGINVLRIDAPNKNELNDVKISVDIQHDWCEWTETIAPTCGTDGQEQRVCQNNHSHVETRSIKGLEHEYTDYHSNNDATCQKNATKSATCNKGCGSVDTIEEIGTKLEHTWDNGVVTKRATKKSEGVMTYTCECGETKTVTIAKLGNDGSGCSGNLAVSLFGMFALMGAVVYIKKKNK